MFNTVERIDDFVPIRRALVSVFDRTGLDAFIGKLLELNPDSSVYATGGTYASLLQALVQLESGDRAWLTRQVDEASAQLAQNPGQALSGYYTLTQEEMLALVTGDIKRIEGWLGKLDTKHATWLWNRLGQERW